MFKKLLIISTFVTIIFSSSVSALSLSCRSCVLMDMDSGRILYEKDIDRPRLIASVTKIMTAVIAIESDKLDDYVVVGKEVLKMYGSNIYIEYGEKIKLLDLLYGLLLRSGNDAAVAIAVYVAGSEEKFVVMMNEYAKKIGMKNTIYRNCHGLDEETENMSTAYDLALLSSYAYKNDMYRKITSTKKYSVKTTKKTYSWTNRNKLLFQYKYANGGKTGYTPKAGRTLVTNASRDQLNLTAVTLNDGNEYASHKSMYEYGFSNYKKYYIIKKGIYKISEKFFKGKIRIKNDFSYPLMESEKDYIKVIVELNKVKYINNKRIGDVKVLLNDKEIYKDGVYAVVGEKKKNIINKIKDKLF